MAEAGQGFSPDTASLPWSRDRSEQGRFLGLLALVCAVFLVPAIWLPGVELPARERAEVETVPPQLVRLIQPPEPVARPEPVVSEPEAPAAPPPEPTEIEVSSPVATVSEPVAVPRPPAPVSQSPEQARQVASRSGLLAMKERLAALRAPGQGAGPSLRTNLRDDAAPAGPEAAPAEVLAGSGGPGAAPPVPEATVAVAGHRAREVVPAPEPEPVRESVMASAAPVAKERSMSNIRRVFDAQKTVLYSLYKRELRQDPTLRGKVLLELVIEPDGSVSACEVVSSELDHPALEQRIALRVRLFNFGADEVGTRRVRFPIDFLPG
ncbi:hypothetical protein BTO32_08165 [Marinobacter lutaoensis]|uniref:TonB C-terminal domain-containing protein n=1 Tax=Marinobacter lutaoensis TaxID=135739 RepID=A0A1V2DV64_9GAMM|nr:AgmX/PglI C-terminal domain-containing protein [Marinobacter lutaoensis]ONF44246.1 hypothetical protein BTO32_08165 [Marinobacter lutaoensis]